MIRSRWFFFNLLLLILLLHSSVYIPKIQSNNCNDYFVTEDGKHCSKLCFFTIAFSTKKKEKGKKSAIFFNPPWEEKFFLLWQRKKINRRSWLGVLCVKFRKHCHQLFRSYLRLWCIFFFISSPICWIYDLSFILCHLFLIVHLYNGSGDSREERSSERTTNGIKKNGKREIAKKEKERE